MKTVLGAIGLSVVLLIGGEAYVFLQVRKGENQSNVDALIHKVVPHKKAADDSRKRLSLPTRYELLGRPKGQKEGLESVVLAIDTGAAHKRVDNYMEPNVIQQLKDIVMDFFKDDRVNAFFRTKKDSYNIKPEIVHFKSGKPSLMLELDFKSIVRMAKEVLRSKKLTQYTDALAQKAAVIYRAVIDNAKRENRIGGNKYF